MKEETAWNSFCFPRLGYLLLFACALNEPLCSVLSRMHSISVSSFPWASPFNAEICSSHHGPYWLYLGSSNAFLLLNKQLHGLRNCARCVSGWL